MPQLDIVTFINQYIWILSSVSAIIVISLISLLPSIKKLIEIRATSSVEFLSFKRNKNFDSFKKLLTIR